MRADRQSTGGGEPSTRTRPRDRKQQILNVARDLFVEMGYHHVTMRLLADRLGIQAGALYRHYANKADLFDAVVRDSLAGLTAPSVDVTLTDALATATTTALTRTYLGALWSREARYLPAGTYAMVRDRLREFTQAYADLFARERGDLTDGQAELLAWGLQSLLASIGRHPARLPSTELGRVVLGASRALCATPLSIPGGAIERPESRLQPVSRRERLLLGAMRLFAERGYQETALADIGAVAEVTGPSLYAHFDSKAALLLASIERGTHALWADLDEALRGNAEPWDALAAVVSGYVHRSKDWSGIVIPVIGEEAIQNTARALQREYVAEWVGLLQDGRPTLEPATSRTLVLIALSVIDDLCRTPHLRNDAFERNVAAMTLAILGSEPVPL